MCRRNVKYGRFVAIRCVFSSSKYSTTRFPLGLGPRPRWRAYDAPPRSLVGWGGGHPLPIPFLLDRLRRLDLGAFGACALYFQESLTYIFVANIMGLSSFKFVQSAPKDASFLQQSAFWPFKVVQDHPRSMILVPIERAYGLPISPSL